MGGAKSVVLAIAILGCSSGSKATDTDAGTVIAPPRSTPPDDDAGDASGPDFGAPSETYPAYAPALPEVQNPAGNPFLTDFTVVPVHFVGDPRAVTAHDFVAKYAASPEWRAQVGEYGVGTMSVAPAVEIAESTPPTLDDSEIQTWLKAKLDASVLGPTDAATLEKTVFLLVYPSGTIVSRGGQTSCGAFHGYHSSGQGAIYAVIPRCTAAPLSEAETLTTAIAHELVEAATDPLDADPGKGAFTYLDFDHTVWGVAMGGPEISDLCNVAGTFWAPPSVGYTIARSWSNVAARAHNDPCVPSPPNEPYFSAFIAPTDAFPLTLSATKTKGVTVPVGATRTFDVMLTSDRPTGGPFTVEAREQRIAASSGKALTLTLDRASGVNGEKVHLTVRANTTTTTGTTAIAIFSKLGGKETVWFTPVALR